MEVVNIFSKNWRTSDRQYKVILERGVRIPVGEGVELDSDIFRPDGGGVFPAILSISPYTIKGQYEPIWPRGVTNPGWGPEGRQSGHLEAGDPSFYTRRGYIHIIANVRGTGNSGGEFSFSGAKEAKDTYEAIEWIAKQPWCDGKVGMFGISYFAMTQLAAAPLNPPHLKCIFAPWGTTDIYRDWLCQGGIFNYFVALNWAREALENPRYKCQAKEELGMDGFKEAVARLLKDEDIAGLPALVEVLNNPDKGINPMIIDILLHPLDDKFWEERRPSLEDIKVPSYIGADWRPGGHLPGAFRNWERIKSTKRMIIGPPSFLDRPLYQLQYESLRWFDYWLKGIDTGIVKEPPINLFVIGANQWKEAFEWPLPETKWTPFYLHEKNLLYEREHWPNEGSDSFFDSPWCREALEYRTPQMVEETELIGPTVMHLYASITNSEVFWVATLYEIDKNKEKIMLTKGWLRGTHRNVDARRSKPWQPFHPHIHPEPLIPNKVYEFTIELTPIGALLRCGSKIELRISCVDEKARSPLEVAASGHMRQQSPTRVTVFHNNEYPSHLLLPITSGNIIGTYLSGGQPFARDSRNT